MKNILILKNKHLLFLISYLNKFVIAGNESRQRSRFIASVIERTKEMDVERVKMLEKHSNKDKDGKSIKIKSEKGDSYDLSIENMTKFQNEYNDYMNEDFILDIAEGNKEKIRKVKELILNSTIPVAEIEAVLYNEVCECFEKVNFNKIENEEEKIEENESENTKEKTE